MYFRLNALEYSDLKNKIQSPIVNARNVVIKQSLAERFVETFTEHVNQNTVINKSEDMVSLIIKPFVNW